MNISRTIGYHPTFSLSVFLFFVINELSELHCVYRYDPLNDAEKVQVFNTKNILIS